ncbi:hypothetical protein GQ53DRAFT_740730 [Thozetella sp. PMI_491]|nr:hypothetical protein GQ53DRAFT_740730 [Thozetella sp. PMI_491]
MTTSRISSSGLRGSDVLRNLRNRASRVWSPAPQDEREIPESSVLASSAQRSPDPRLSGSHPELDSGSQEGEDQDALRQSSGTPPPPYEEIGGFTVEDSSQSAPAYTLAEAEPVVEDSRTAREAEAQETMPRGYSMPNGSYRPINLSLLDFVDFPPARSSTESQLSLDPIAAPRSASRDSESLVDFADHTALAGGTRVSEDPSSSAWTTLAAKVLNRPLSPTMASTAARDGSTVSTPRPSAMGLTLPAPSPRGYGSIPSSILEDFPDFTKDNAGGNARCSSQAGEACQRNPVSSSGLVSPGTNNPYINAIQERQNRMTINYLRSKEASSSTAQSSETASDFGFGQRYQKIEGVKSIMVTNQRRAAEVLSGDRECTICIETKAHTEFLTAAISSSCLHPPTVCRACVKASIKAQIETKGFDSVRCPECSEPMEYGDVEYYADAVDGDRYRQYSIKNALGDHENFVQCAHGCEYWQIQVAGSASPIFTCERCRGLTCAHHKVPWHANITCDEYDQLLADPENFRSRWELLPEDAAEALQHVRELQDAVDRGLAQGLRGREERARLEGRLDAERRRKAARETQAFMERMERLEQAEKLRKDIMRRKAEDTASEQTVGKTTKPCPNDSCQAPIEKNLGCQHMTCQRCLTEFCWNCNQLWRSGHNIHCGRER